MTDNISETIAGIGFGGGYLFIKSTITPSLWEESIHSAFAIATALIIAVLTTIVIHYVKKILK